MTLQNIIKISYFNTVHQAYSEWYDANINQLLDI